MPEKAKVTSIEALESFRSSLIVYLANAMRVLDEISGDVQRTRLWIEDDRLGHWQHETQRRTRKLQEKQHELFSARMSSLREATQAENMAVLKAKRALNEAQAKLDLVKKWNRHYDNRVQPLAKDVDKLRDVLAVHMGKAVVYLTQAIRTLGDYADLSPPETLSAKTVPQESGTTGATVTPETEARKS
ncbi:MAG: hypothetical protein HY298_26815 [Verrucomicrobia bacterium]|nr:hypothetical protein [Verrucomicrobiota bacterium]